MRKKTGSEKKIPVLVTTAHRGVFFGHADPKKISGKIVTIYGAKCCIYWHKSIGGFLGLASIGPNAECKIGPACDELTLQDVTSIARVTDVAAKAWGAASWK